MYDSSMYASVAVEAVEKLGEYSDVCLIDAKSHLAATPVWQPCHSVNAFVFRIVTLSQSD